MPPKGARAQRAAGQKNNKNALIFFASNPLHLSFPLFDGAIFNQRYGGPSTHLIVILCLIFPQYHSFQSHVEVLRRVTYFCVETPISDIKLIRLLYTQICKILHQNVTEKYLTVLVITVFCYRRSRFRGYYCKLNNTLWFQLEDTVFY